MTGAPTPEDIERVAYDWSVNQVPEWIARLWLAHGGHHSGPHVEKASMPMRSLTAFVAAIATMPSDDWRPIDGDTPRDRFILVYTPADGEMDGFVAMAKWRDLSWYGVTDEGMPFDPLQIWDRVTHWRPLPSPPKEPV